MPHELYERVLASMGTTDTNVSERIRELVELGLAVEDAVDSIDDLDLPDHPRDQRLFVRQALLHEYGEE